MKFLSIFLIGILAISLVGLFNFNSAFADNTLPPIIASQMSCQTGNYFNDGRCFLGYDARDIDALKVHDGTTMAACTGSDPTTQGKNIDERVAVYMKNEGSSQMQFSEIILAGTVYRYDTSAAVTKYNSTTDLVPGEYSVLTSSTRIIPDKVPVVQVGKTVTILFDLADYFPIGRDAQFKLTTTNGVVYETYLVMGVESKYPLNYTRTPASNCTTVDSVPNQTGQNTFEDTLDDAQPHIDNDISNPSSQNDVLSELIEENRKLKLELELERQQTGIDEITEQVDDYVSEALEYVKGFFDWSFNFIQDEILSKFKN